MQTKDFIGFLEEAHMPVFTLDDAVKILRQSREYTRLFLYRCAKAGLIDRAERGTYYLKERHNEYEIASHILSPSYISMVSALAHYGLTTQMPRVVYVVSTKRHKTLTGIAGFDIAFKKIREGMLFGYHKESAGNISIADPEKAIVDIYYFNDVSDLDETVLDRPARINIAKLVRYAQRSRKKSVITGIAGLLRAHGYKIYAETLIDHRPYKLQHGG